MWLKTATCRWALHFTDHLQPPSPVRQDILKYKRCQTQKALFEKSHLSGKGHEYHIPTPLLLACSMLFLLFTFNLSRGIPGEKEVDQTSEWDLFEFISVILNGYGWVLGPCPTCQTFNIPIWVMLRLFLKWVTRPGQRRKDKQISTPLVERFIQGSHLT